MKCSAYVSCDTRYKQHFSIWCLYAECQISIIILSVIILGHKLQLNKLECSQPYFNICGYSLSDLCVQPLWFVDSWFTKPKPCYFAFFTSFVNNLWLNMLIVAMLVCFENSSWVVNFIKTGQLQYYYITL